MPNRRNLLLGIGTSLATILAGCTGGTDNNNAEGENNNSSNENGEGNGNSNPSDENDGENNLYEKDASSYLLSADEIPGELEKDQVEGTDRDPDGLTSGRILRLVSADGEDEVNLAVGVFETVDDASSYLSDQRNSYESTNEEEIGDEAFSASGLSANTVEARIANVTVQCLGTIQISNLREITKTQIDAISE